MKQYAIHSRWIKTCQTIGMAKALRIFHTLVYCVRNTHEGNTWHIGKQTCSSTMCPAEASLSKVLNPIKNTICPFKLEA